MSARSAAVDQFRTWVDGSNCVYCGEIPNSVEHFPPRTVSTTGLCLPACMECNTFAGTEHPFDFYARSEFVKARLRAKYAGLLKTPDWSEADMAEMGRAMRDKIAENQKQRDIAKDRISWNAEMYLIRVAPENGFVSRKLAQPNRVDLESDVDLPSNNNRRVVNSAQALARVRAERERYKIEKGCAHCAKVFVTARKTQTYCNSTCAMRAFNARKPRDVQIHEAPRLSPLHGLPALPVRSDDEVM